MRLEILVTILLLGSLIAGTLANADWYGDITNVATDSWEWETTQGYMRSQTSVCELGNDYYLVLTSGTDSDGFLYIFKVFQNGTIRKTPSDSWEYDDTSSAFQTLTEIGNDFYAVVYYDGGTAQTTLFTFKAWDNGTMRHTMHDSEVMTSGGEEFSFVNVGSSDTYALTYRSYPGAGRSIYIETVKIWSTNGTIAKKAETHWGNDNQEEGVIWSQKIDSDTMFVAERATDDDINIKTYNISANGAISAGDSWDWGFDSFYLHICELSSNYYALTYRSDDTNGNVSTITISDAGTITKSFIDALEFSSNTVKWTAIYPVAGNAYGITYQDSSGDGWLKTVNITATGTIDATVSDSWEFDGVDSKMIAVLEYLGSNEWMIIWSGFDYDGFMATFPMHTESSAPPGVSNTNPSPADRFTAQSLTPTLSVDVNSSEGYLMNVTFRENISGVWADIGTNASVTNGTYSQTATNFTSYSTLYQWSTNTSDGHGNWDNDTYYLLTIPNPSPYSISDSYFGLLNPYFIDEWQWSIYKQIPQSEDSIIHLGNTYYMMVGQGQGDDGYLYSFNIADNGIITESIVNTWEFDTGGCTHSTLEHISGNTYAVVYGDGTNTNIFTFKAWDNGTIRHVKIDTDTLLYRSCPAISIDSMGANNLYAISYREYGTGIDDMLETVKIWENGTINKKSTQIVYSSALGYKYKSIDSIPIDTNTVLTWFVNDTNDGCFKSYNVTANGAISLSDTYWSEQDHREGLLHEITDNYFVLITKKYLGNLTTLTVSDAGTITKSLIDFLHFGSSPSNFFITYISGETYAISYRESLTNLGYMSLVDISDTGTVSNLRNTWQFDSSRWFSPLVQVDDEVWLTIYPTESASYGYMGTFYITNPTPVTKFTEYLIDNNAATADQADGVDIGDMDTDGDIDIVMIERDVISWYENDGAESFTQHTIDASFGTSGYGDIYICDIDADGDLDFVATRSTSDVSVYTNDGLLNPTFGETNLDNGLDQARGPYARDIDDDGDLDVSCAVTTDDDFMWYRNLGSGSWSAAHKEDADFDGAYDTSICDIDNDGLLDLVGVSIYDGLHWYENSTGSFTEHSLASGDGELTNHIVIDMDGDGFNDTVTTAHSNNHILYYKHNGSTTNPGVDRYIIGNLTDCTDLKVTDFDEDGDYDIIVCGYNAVNRDSALSWFENDGSEVFTEHAIRTRYWNQNFHLSVADIDQDGLDDIVLTSYGNDTLSWLKHDISWEPMNYNPHPTNKETNVLLNPTVNITVYDPDGDTMDVEFWSNSSGAWVLFGQNTTVTNGTYSQTTSNFTSVSTRYWWSVNTTDGTYEAVDIYYFDTVVVNAPTGMTVTSGRNPGCGTDMWVNISWTQDADAERTYLEANNLETWARGAGIYGVLQNSSLEYYNWTPVADGITFYFQAWSFDNDTHSFSPNYAECNETTTANIFNHTAVIPTNSTLTTEVWVGGVGMICSGLPFGTPGGGTVTYWYKLSANPGWINNGTENFVSGVTKEHIYTGLATTTKYDFAFNFTFTWGDCSADNYVFYWNNTLTGGVGINVRSVNRSVALAWKAYDDIDLVNVTFYTNATGSWLEICNYTNVDCSATLGLNWGKWFKAYLGPVTNNEIYYWRVVANDCFGDEMNHTFHFKTAYNWNPQRNYTLHATGADHYPVGVTLNTYNVNFTQYIEDINNDTVCLQIWVENRSGWVKISDTYVTNSSTALGMGVEGVNYDVYPRFDIDRDGDIDTDDSNLVLANIGSGLAIYDIDMDTDVDADDAALVFSHIGETSIVNWSFNATDNVSRNSEIGWTNTTYAFAVTPSGVAPGGPGGGGAPTEEEEEPEESEYWYESDTIKVGPAGLIFGEDLYIPWWIVGLFFGVVIVLSLTRKRKIFVVRKKKS